MRLKLKLITLMIFLPLLAYFWPSYLGGDTQFVVVNGQSMLPTFDPNSLAIVKKSPSYDVGDIAVYKDNDLNKLVIHRIIAQSDNGFTFKGDNNRYPDHAIVTQDNLVGKVIFVAPYIGYLPILFRNPVILALFILASAATMLGKKEKKGIKGNKKKKNESFFPIAILINLVSYAVMQVSISLGNTPTMDGLTNYLFKIFEPYIASTFAFATWFSVLIGIHFIVKHYQTSSAKRLEHFGKNGTLQIKEQGSMQLLAEAFYILLTIIQTIYLIVLVKGLFPSGQGL